MKRGNRYLELARVRYITHPAYPLFRDVFKLSFENVGVLVADPEKRDLQKIKPSVSGVYLVIEKSKDGNDMMMLTIPI